MGFLKWLAGLLVILWILGLLFRIAGGFIHILLVLAIIAFIIGLF